MKKTSKSHNIKKYPPLLIPRRKPIQMSIMNKLKYGSIVSGARMQFRI
jgi:hypothetical protein